MPCKQAGFRSCFLSKTSAIQAIGIRSIASSCPFLFSQLVDMIGDEWETFTHQRGSWRYQKHPKCPQIPFCGQLKPTSSPYRQQSLGSCSSMCRQLGHQLDHSICSVDCSGYASIDLFRAESLVPCPKIPCRCLNLDLNLLLKWKGFIPQAPSAPGYLI